MRYKLVLLLIVLVAFGSPPPGIDAQNQPGNPLIIRSGSTLYTWQQPGSSLERLKLAGNILGSLALSPDSQWLAYQVVPSVISAQMGIQSQPGDIAPFDLHLYNLSQKQDIVVYKQTLTVQQISAGGPYITLRPPQWSPDGKQIAWLSFPVYDPSPNRVENLQANIYDVAAKKTASFDTKFQPKDWTTHTIAAWTGSVYAIVASSSNVVRFAPDGRELGRTSLSTPVDTLIPVSQKGQVSIGVIDPENVLSLIDPATGQIRTPDGGVEQYSLSAPGPSLSIFANQRPDGVLKWQVAQPGGKISPLNLVPLAISPAGDQIAAIDNNTAYIWKDGQVRPIGSTGDKGVQVTDLLWSGMGWRVQPAAVNGMATMSATTQAKLPGAPVLILVRGDLYAWRKFDKTPRPLTKRGDVSGALVSPDSHYAVYRAQPRVFGVQSFASYRQIWLLDVTSGQSTILDGVPADGQDVLRLSPSWSPDGTQIAWIELTWPGRDHRLIIYDMKSQTAKIVVAGLPFPTDIFKTWMTWGDPGLALLWTASIGSEVRLYMPSGKLIMRTPLGANIYIDYPMWITEKGGDYIGVLSLENPDGLQLIEPYSGLRRLSQGEIELFSPTNEALHRQSISVFFANSPANSLDNWRVTLPDQTIDPIHVIGGWDAVPAISPGGMEVAYAIYGQAFVYRDGEVLAIPLTGKEESGNTPVVSWGSVHYRLRVP